MSLKDIDIHSTEFQLALAVLTGNREDALVLADHLLERYGDGHRYIPPLQKFDCTWENLRVVLFLKDRAMLNPETRERIKQEVLKWLSGSTRLLTVQGVDRIEVYQIKDGGSRLVDRSQDPLLPTNWSITDTDETVR